MTDRHTVPYGGERIDRIAKQFLRTERDGATEAMLAANPGLAAVAVDGIVPAGTVVVAPVDWKPVPAAVAVLPWE